MKGNQTRIYFLINIGIEQIFLHDSDVLGTRKPDPRLFDEPEKIS